MKSLIISIHGVGDPAAGDTVDDLTSAIAASESSPFRVSSETVWLEEHKEGHLIKTFPTHIRRVIKPASEIVFAEVWWGNLSRAREGLLGAIQEIIGLIFGLRHLVRESIRQAGLESSWFAWLCNVIVFLLHGFMLALNGQLIALILLLLVRFTVNSLTREDVDAFTGSPESVAVFVGFLSLIIAIAAALLYLRRNDQGVRWFLFALATSAFALSAYAFTCIVWSDARELFASIAWLKTPYLDLQEHLKAFAPYAAAIMLSFVFVWLLIWVILVVLLLTAKLADRNVSPDQRIGVRTAYLSLVAMGWLWGLSIPTFWAIAYTVLLNDVMPGKLLEKQIPLMSLHWIFALLLASIACFTLHSRSKWSRKRKQEPNYNPDDAAPRLLMPKWVEPLVAIYPLLVLSTLIALLLRFVLNFNIEALTLPTALTIATAGLIGPWVLAMPQSRYAIDVALDIVNHFRQDDRLSGQRAYIIRERILHRCRTVIRELIRREGPCRIWILSHSQGTVLAILTLQQ